MTSYYFGKYTISAIKAITGIVEPEDCPQQHQQTSFTYQSQSQRTRQTQPHQPMISEAQALVNEEEKVKRSIARLEAKKKAIVEKRINEMKKAKALELAEAQLREEVNKRFLEIQLEEEAKQEAEDDRILNEILLKRASKEKLSTCRICKGKVLKTQNDSICVNPYCGEIQ
jgi:hypothetical protein